MGSKVREYTHTRGCRCICKKAAVEPTEIITFIDSVETTDIAYKGDFVVYCVAGEQYVIKKDPAPFKLDLSSAEDIDPHSNELDKRCTKCTSREGGPDLAVEMLADDIPPTGRFTAACGEPQAVLEGDFIVATGSAAGQKELSRMERDVFLEAVQDDTDPQPATGLRMPRCLVC